MTIEYRDDFGSQVADNAECERCGCASVIDHKMASSAPGADENSNCVAVERTDCDCRCHDGFNFLAFGVPMPDRSATCS